MMFRCRYFIENIVKYLQSTLNFGLVCPLTALAYAFPISICVTVLPAKTNFYKVGSPLDFIIWPLLPRKNIIIWNPPRTRMTLLSASSWLMVSLAFIQRGWSNVTISWMLYFMHWLFTNTKVEYTQLMLVGLDRPLGGNGKMTSLCYCLHESWPNRYDFVGIGDLPK